jgi:hypothetical protein
MQYLGASMHFSFLHSVSSVYFVVTTESEQDHE